VQQERLDPVYLVQVAGLARATTFFTKPIEFRHNAAPTISTKEVENA
jgi:hypothetical protein